MCDHKTDAFQLSDKTKEILLKFSTSRSLPAPLVLRAKIILQAAEGRNNLEIIAESKVSFTSVCCLRNRFYNNRELIAHTEECLEPDGNGLELENVIKSVLSDAPGSEKEPVFSQKQILLIHELASKNPKDFGWKLNHWNLPALAAEAARQKIVDSILPASIERFLNPAEISSMELPSLAHPKRNIKPVERV